MPSDRKKPAQSEAEPTREGKGRRRFPVWKKALFTLLTLLVFFGVLELILFLAGVKPLLYEEDPYVGFSSQIPLYVEQGEDADGDTLMVTARNKLRYFNKQQFTKEKKDGVTRVFCLGGSTTYGRPYDDATSFCGWLRELLPVADPSQDWELINAGGISYASYRVAALMEELSEYEPDIFIVYCGQNEFLERRTYSGIIDMPDSVRGLTAVMSHTRTYSAMVRLIRGFGKESAGEGGKSEQLPGEVAAILDNAVGPQDYERDEELEKQVLAHYRFNMARIADIARAGGAEVVFVTPASNLRHCSPFKSQHRNGLSEEEKLQWDELFQSARAHFEAKRFSEALGDLDAAAKIDDRYAHAHYLRGRVLDELERYEDARAAYQQAVDEDVCPLRALSPMPGIVSEVARDRDVPVVDFAALVEKRSPQGVAGEELFLDHVHPTIDGHRMLALAVVEEMDSQKMLTIDSNWNEAAAERVSAAVMGKVDPKAQGVAMRNLSKVFSWAGKMEDAYRAAKKALELFPGDAETHYQVGNLAHHLGKTDEAVERLSYLVGADLKPGVSFYLKAHTQLAAILTGRGEHAASEQVLEKLLRLDPGNAAGKQQKLALLTAQGKRLIEAGKPAEAAQKLSEVVRMQPENFDAKVQFAVALMRAGDLQAAAPVLRSLIDTRPKYLPAYDNLSFVLAQLGRLDDAENICRQALKIDPNHEAARKNLQLILKKKASGG